jgi:Flp pilus assembly pilin Flp
MKRLLRRMWAEQDGQDLIEYGLIAALVSVVALGALQGSGQSLATLWSDIPVKLQQAT